MRALRRPEPGSFDLAELLDGPPRSPEQMEADLRELVAPHIDHPAVAEILKKAELEKLLAAIGHWKP